MGKIFNQIKKGTIMMNAVFICRYCEKEYLKGGLAKHCSGKEHQENWSKYGDNPPIKDTHPPYQKKVKISTKTANKLLASFAERK